MKNYNRIKLTVTYGFFIALVAGAWLFFNESESKSFAGRYQTRSRTADFFARSTNNPAAKYSGHIRSSGGKTLPTSRGR